MLRVATTLSYDEFCACAQASIGQFQTRWLNRDQEDAVSAKPAPPLFIVAGPGSGKTTVLALRALKHIFVDGFLPQTIMATTFTKKAAHELRSRILAWGVEVHKEAERRATAAGNTARLDWLKQVDINAIRTGTLDSLAQEMVDGDRKPGEISPIVIEKFMTQGILRRDVLFGKNWYRDPDLERHLAQFSPSFPGMADFKEKLKAVHSFADRTLHDDIDLPRYGHTGLGHSKLQQIVDDYRNALRSGQLMDFGLLERSVLDRLLAGRLTDATDNLNALLVDEFQDTNYLQEQIYYELSRRSKAALTVVGDDDQSIFRFRGATVEIFSNLETRLVLAVGSNWKPKRIDLTENYRSTDRIVNFCNYFITAEPAFQAARAPGKKACVPKGPHAGTADFPVLGMFRNTARELADSLSSLLHDVFRGSGYTFAIAGGHALTIQRGIGGDFGDAVLLAAQVNEWQQKRAPQAPEPRLPLLLRQKLNGLGVEVFNPRGRALAEIPEVACLLGLMLECIDPGAAVQAGITAMRSTTRACYDNWRQAARSLVTKNPAPPDLAKFVHDWATRSPSSGWPTEWPLLDLMFTCVAWFPMLQRIPEGQVYLEAVARTINEASTISSYGASIRCDGTVHDGKSVQHAIRDIFEPIAEGSIDIDEEIMPYVPRSHFPIMTIHQAKGLEFPMVIVDVGSHFTGDWAAQRKHRYPDSGDSVHDVEDHTSGFSPVGSARITRPGILRAFDDLRRLYYVAKSRPHAVLLLVGLMTQMALPGTAVKVPSVATGDLFVPMSARRGARGRPVPLPRVYQFIPAESWTPGCPANVVATI